MGLVGQNFVQECRQSPHLTRRVIRGGHGRKPSMWHGEADHVLPCKRCLDIATIITRRRLLYSLDALQRLSPKTLRKASIAKWIACHYFCDRALHVSRLLDARMCVQETHDADGQHGGVKEKHTLD